MADITVDEAYGFPTPVLTRGWLSTEYRFNTERRIERFNSFSAAVNLLFAVVVLSATWCISEYCMRRICAGRPAPPRNPEKGGDGGAPERKE
ncbi:MAG: hypothetical protein NTW87_08635 [Planctomycetota bacterium]|nr:hypothetical protein [Planctomycetota bacterium]